MQQYYEAILQIRSAPEDVHEAVIKAVREAGAKGVFVSRVASTKNGKDYYLSSKRFTVNLGRKLKKRFKGQIKLSRKLYGKDRQTSRLLYRVTVLYRHSQP
jgi:nonsense-mediated mRNA decay protein 3